MDRRQRSSILRVFGPVTFMFYLLCMESREATVYVKLVLCIISSTTLTTRHLASAEIRFASRPSRSSALPVNTRLDPQDIYGLPLLFARTATTKQPMRTACGDQGSLHQHCLARMLHLYRLSRPLGRRGTVRETKRLQ